MAEPAVEQRRPILALVTDLFFALKIGDTAKSLGWPIQFAGSPAELLEAFPTTRPTLIIADLTLDSGDGTALLERLTSEADTVGVAILGYTTHADWKRTEPLHHRYTKVVTKDTLSRRLPELIQQLIQRG